MKKLNQWLYNYYDEEIRYLNQQLELCNIPDCNKIINRIISYSKARDRAFEGLYIDNKFMPPNITL